MQQVQVYEDVFEAAKDMRSWIRNGWRVHTCTTSVYYAGSWPHYRVLVIYEQGRH